jgi:hypothetical protein
MMMGMIKKNRSRQYRFKAQELNSVIAYAASLMLSGVPPAVCESVLTEFYCSVRKSLHTIIS